MASCTAGLAGASGAEQWRAVITGTRNHSNDTALAITVDAAGDVLAAGVIDNSDTGPDFMVIKLAGTNGGEAWRTIIDGPGTEDDQARAIIVDAAGDVLIAGGIDNGSTGSDFTVIKLAGSTGGEVWRTVIDGSGTGSDTANAVSVDEAGDVLAAGWTSHTSPRLLPRMEASFTVVKLRGTDGGDF